jgi:Neutral/alkaline non-lysosomal ceramidase, N-terminal
MLLAGAARQNLEPPLGIAMAGYGRRVGRAARVHDQLAAQALVLSDGERKVAFVGVDLLALGIRIADEVAAVAAKRTDILAESILIGATHTHSAPLFNIFATPRADAHAGDDRSIEWERALPAKIVAAIVDANARLEPAVIKAGRGRFTLGTNRRLLRPDGSIQLAANYAGVADPEVSVLGAFRPDRSAISVILNYPCHGVVLCEDNLDYSRDYAGFAMDKIEGVLAKSGRAPVAIFLQGATGNIDPRSRGSFDVAAGEGKRMADAALGALASAPPIESAPILTRRVALNLKLKRLDDALATARNYVAQTELSLARHRGGDGFQGKRLSDHRAQAREALGVLAALEEANRRDRRVNLERRELATHMTIVTIGDLAFVGLPGEAFVEFGLALKANPFFAQTFVVGYCNDLIGYIPTRAAYPEGGYEVETARVAEGTGEMMVARALDELAAMRAGGA